MLARRRVRSLYCLRDSPRLLVGQVGELLELFSLEEEDVGLPALGVGGQAGAVELALPEVAVEGLVAQLQHSLSSGFSHLEVSLISFKLPVNLTLGEMKVSLWMLLPSKCPSSEVLSRRVNFPSPLMRPPQKLPLYSR